MASTGTLSDIRKNKVGYDNQIRMCLDEIRNRRFQNPKEWRQGAEWLLKKGRELGDDYLQGYALNQIAQAEYVSGGKTVDVYNYIIEGIHHQQRAEDSQTLGSSYNMLGIIESLQGFQPQAIDFFLTSLSFREQSEDGKWQEGVIYSNIGTCYEVLGDYKTGLSYLEMAVPRLEAYPSHPAYAKNVIFAGTSLARLSLLQHKDLDRAQKLYEKYRALADRKQEEDGYTELLLAALMVWIACYEGDTEAKNTHLTEFIDLLSDLNVFDNIAMEAHGLVRLLMQLGDDENAVRLARVILKSIDRLALGMRIQFLRCKVELLQRLGRTEESLEASYQFFEAYSQSERDNSETRVFSANIRIEMEKLRKENQILTIRAETDELTGLPNRYHMNDHAEVIFRRAWENETSLAVEILDVDYFKEINDIFGHLEGDRYLCAVADELKKMADQNPDIYCARYGGDEFVILYERMTDEEVMALAKDLKARVEGLKLPNPGSKVCGHVTISQGVRNTVPSKSNRLWDYLSTSDTALYRVKKNNRGGIMLVHYRNDPEIN